LRAGRAKDVDDRRDPLQQLARASYERPQLRFGGVGRESVEEPFPLHGRDRLVVTGDGDVDELLEQRRLVAEDEVDGLHRDARSLGDALQRRRTVALLDEQLVRGLQDPLPRVPRLLPPSHVLEIGCGSTGGFVPAMRESGYHAVGVDPAAPTEPVYYRTEFEQHERVGRLDAIVACTSLHHVGDIDHVLDRTAAALAPDGVLIVVEWAYETFDEATARWCFERLPDGGEPGWLHGHRERWLASGQPWHAYLKNWAGRERLHSGHTMLQALQTRFQTRLIARAPYFFSELHPISEADEQAAVDAGEVRATGIRYVATSLATRP
jgi:SAM-dependent methyltransferase